jgi:hypothetical protein
MSIIRWMIILSLSLLFACESKIDSSSLPSNPHFIMADNLMCTIKVSSDNKEVGKKIALIGITTTQPKAKFKSGLTSPLQKVFESETTLTCLLIASVSGSVDTFVIDKKKGHFSRATAGSYEGVYSSASVGTCQ